MEKNIFVHIFHRNHCPIRGGQDESSPLGRHSLRIAEEIEGKQEECNPQRNQGIFYVRIVEKKEGSANKKQANCRDRIENIIAIFSDQIVNSGG